MILNFEVTGIDEIKRKIENYKTATRKKNKIFVEKMLKIGQKIAIEKAKDIPGRYGTHGMGQYVYFKINIDENNDYCEGYLCGYETPLQAVWKDSMGIHTTTIRPLMMLEFGSAGLAIPMQERFGSVGGQGTVAIKGHEKETEWHFIDEDGKLKVGTAIQPTQPMLYAYIDMMQSVKTLKEEVYKS